MTSTEGLLLVDLQPAYLGHGKSGLMQRVFEHIATLPADAPLVALFVHEELSGDFLEDVQQYWRDQGAGEELIERITWLEKDYAFLRGWMDNGVDDDVIIAVLQRLRQEHKWDSRDLAPEVLDELAPARPTYSPLMLNDYVHRVVRTMRQAAARWFTCGGGLDACLKEIELVLDAQELPYTQLSHLTYY